MSGASTTAPRDTIPLRYLADINPSVDFSDLDDDAEVTFLPMDRVKSGYFIPNTERLSKLASSYNSFENGDIVLAKVTPCFENGNIAIADDLANGKGFGSSELYVIRPNGIEQKFLFYCLQSGLFKQEGEASMRGAGGLKRISSDVLRQHRVRAFPRQLQQGIATYLDHETARIDALIAEKESMLSLLEQKRSALISRSVTRGLYPQAPTKPSGLDWLGEIPKHWKVQRGKFIFTQSDLPVREDDEIVTCFRDGQVTLRKNRREEGFTNAILELGYQGIREGQLVLHSMDAFAGAIGVSDSDGKCSPEYIICDPIRDDVNPQYFSVAMRLMALRGYVQAACTAVRERAPRIRFSHVANMFLPLPPKDEQDEIVHFISDNRDSTAALETALRDSITLLKERRSALITAAVTGKKVI